MPRARWWAGFFIAAAVTALLSVQAYDEGLPAELVWVPESDKILHVVLGGALSFFLDGGIARREVALLPRLRVPLAAIVVLVPAGVEEYLQRYAALRTSSLWDYLADCVGVTLGVLLSRRVGRSDAGDAGR